MDRKQLLLLLRRQTRPTTNPRPDSSSKSGTPSPSGRGTSAPTPAPSAATSSTSPRSKRRQTRGCRTTPDTLSHGASADTSSTSTASHAGSRRAPSARCATASGSARRRGDPPRAAKHSPRSARAPAHRESRPRVCASRVEHGGGAFCLRVCVRPILPLARRHRACRFAKIEKIATYGNLD